LRHWGRGRYRLVVSRWLIAEIETTLAKPYFMKIGEPHETRRMLDAVIRGAKHVSIPPQINRFASHPEDDLILATAVAGSADYLVTGDRMLLGLEVHAGIPIITARHFLDRLETDVINGTG